MNKWCELYKKEVLKSVKTIQDAFDNSLISESRMVKYLIKRDFKQMRNDENLTEDERKIDYISEHLADKYFVSSVTARQYYYSKDQNNS